MSAETIYNCSTADTDILRSGSYNTCFNTQVTTNSTVDLGLSNKYQLSSTLH